MNISVRIDALFKLLWARKLYILVVTVFLALIALPISAAQYDYVMRQYEEASFNPVEGLYSTAMTAYISISDSRPANDTFHPQIPVQSIAQVMEKSSVIRESIFATQQVFPKVGNISTGKESFSISALGDIDLLQISHKSMPEAIFQVLVENLVNKTRDELSPLYEFSWEAKYTSASRSEAEEYMTLPQKPPARVRVVGMAALLGFVLTCGIILIVDIVRPVVKDAQDIKSNLNLPVLLKCDREDVSYTLYPVGRLKNSRRIRAVKIRHAVDAEIPVLCVRRYRTSYSSIFLEMERIPNKNNLVVFLL